MNPAPLPIVGTVLAALLVPIVWGIGSAWLFDRFRQWRACRPPAQPNNRGDQGT